MIVLKDVVLGLARCKTRRVTVVESGECVWPDDLPAQCPPADATPASGVAYRIVKNDPPTSKDFVRPRDLPRKTPIPDGELCAHSALSIFTDLSDVLLGIKLIPGFSKKKVVTGVLTGDTGVTSGSPSSVKSGTQELVLKSHRDWWICLGVAPETLFRVAAP